LLIALIGNGFVLQLVSYAAPAIVQAWQIDSAALSAAFSLHLLGITIGSVWLGRAGDRYGRRPIVLLCHVLIAITTLACLAATTPTALSILRLLAGIGIGGMVPNVIALATELAPEARRTTYTSLVLSGIALGSALPAPLVAILVPQFGWQALFAFAALFVLFILLALALWLPESAAFKNRATTLVETDSRGGLFHQDLAALTLCLWLMYGGAMLAMHLITSWLPLLLQADGITAARAANLTGLVHLAGTAATLLATFFLRRLGYLWLLGMVAIALLSVGSVAVAGFASPALALFIAGIGFGMVGIQGALGTIAGRIYPASIRPTGVGTALAVGRGASMFGPALGGYLQTAGFAGKSLFTLPLWALAVTLLAALVFVRRAPSL
jgi:MFS transporter, AAHS family, 4-hydroxybenzoate transporter